MLTHYIVPARNAISVSVRRLRSASRIKEAQKLGRVPPLAYSVCQLTLTLNNNSTYQIASDKIQKTLEHFVVLSGLLQAFPLPLCKSSVHLRVSISKEFQETLYMTSPECTSSKEINQLGNSQASQHKRPVCCSYRFLR